MDDLAIIVLAAGASKRLGRAKQLLPFKNTTLLNHTLKTCVNAELGPVYVVLGAHDEEIQATLDSSICKPLFHKDWPEGLSSSIAFGVNQVEHPNLKGVLLVLADQVFLNIKVLQDLAANAQKGAKLINCAYLKGSGPPSYFDRQYFKELKSLKGDHGAKQVVLQYEDELRSVSFPQGHIDIDKPEDLSYLDL